MQPDDFDNFARVLDAAYSLHSKSLTADARSLFFAALGKYSLADVRKAFSAHISDPQRGQYPPKPADLIAHLQGDATKDGRLEPAEAWAIARLARDESESVVWTQEMAEALNVVRDLEGDEYAARTAFVARYGRLVADARAEGRKPHWFASWGFDASKREAVALEAVRTGQLQLEHTRAVLPQLAAPSVADSAKAQAQRAEVMRLVASVPSHAEKLAQQRALEIAKQREDIEDRKRDIAQRVDEYAASHA